MKRQKDILNSANVSEKKARVNSQTTQENDDNQINHQHNEALEAEVFVKDETSFINFMANVANGDTQDLEKLSQLVMHEDFNWNAPVTAEGAEQGKTPFYYLMVAVSKGYQRAIKVLPQVATRVDLLWNKQAIAGPDQGKTPFYLLMAAIANGRKLNSHLIFQILARGDFNWDLPVTAQGPHQGMTPLFLLMVAASYNKKLALAILPQILAQPDLQWNAPVMAEGANQGKTPLYMLMGLLVEGHKPATAEILSGLVTHPDLNWNAPVTGDGPDKGETPLYLLMQAAVEGKELALTIVPQVATRSDLQWNAPVLAEGSNQGQTPLYLLTAIFDKGHKLTPNTLSSIMTHQDLNWNIPITGMGPRQGETALYLLIATIAKGYELDLNLLFQVLAQKDLNWNLPVLTAENAQGPTPLYALMGAVLNGRDSALKLLPQIAKRRDLNWNFLITEEGPHKGMTPLYALMKAVGRGIEPISWQVLEHLFTQPPVIMPDPNIVLADGQTARGYLNDGQQAALDLWISLQKACTLKEDPDAVREHLEITAQLAANAFEKGYDKAYLLMVQFFLEQGDDHDNAATFFAKIPADHATYAAANLCLLKAFQRKAATLSEQELTESKKCLSRIPKDNEHYEEGCLVLASLLLARVPYHQSKDDTVSAELCEKERQVRKTANAKRRDQLWQVIETTLPSKEALGEEIRKNAAFLYLYKTKLAKAPSKTQAQAIANLQASNPENIRIMLDNIRENIKLKNKFNKIGTSKAD